MNSSTAPPVIARPIPLTQGKTAMVSPQDFRKAIKRKWCLLRKRNGDLYAQTNIKIAGVWKRILLHRFLMDAKPGQQIDHQNGNGLDCTRENMRFATHGQNIHNQKGRAGLSRFKGVSWSGKAKKWFAQITCNREYHYLGLHASEEDAARAYDKAAKRLHGEFARLNFPAETS